MSDAIKSRDIPLSELYANLQLEYISYFLRSKVYCKDFAERYKTVCDAKKEKIDRISNRNSLPSIFNDEVEKERYIQMFLNPSGTPNFTYKDETIKAKMGCWDGHYYFFGGVSVKILIAGQVRLGVITHNSRYKKIATVIDEFKNEHVLHYNNITRIFPEDFFTFN